MSNLWICSRCKLKWLENEPPTQCPRCLRRSGIPPAIMVGKFNVKDIVVRTYGEPRGLCLAEIRSGLEALDLGDRCPHGCISHAICNDCRNAQEAA